MYVTRPLSMYKNQPDALSLPPPEGPNSGILVVQDEEAEETCCFGLCKKVPELLDLPFPQNKDLTLRYSTGVGENKQDYHFYATFIPVLDQPLSLNRYYVIQTHGRHKGEAYTNSSEEDTASCCFFSIVKEVPLQPLDHDNIYQQFEVIRVQGRFSKWGRFTARAVTPDGIPPRFLEREGWEAQTASHKSFQLGEALGLNASLRARLPPFDFPLTCRNSSPVVVGKWYCPFMFIREGIMKDQIRNSAYYQMTLEQNWEQVFECDNIYGEGNSVVVDVNIEREVVSIGEKVARNVDVADGVMWFRSVINESNVSSVGLSMAIVERMRWEQGREGYVGSNERQVRLKKVEEIRSVDGWKKYGCYILVERFVLTRMDGSLVLTYDFKHTHKIQSKWE